MLGFGTPEEEGLEMVSSAHITCYIDGGQFASGSMLLKI